MVGSDITYKGKRIKILGESPTNYVGVTVNEWGVKVPVIIPKNEWANARSGVHSFTYSYDVSSWLTNSALTFMPGQAAQQHVEQLAQQQAKANAGRQASLAQCLNKK